MYPTNAVCASTHILTQTHPGVLSLSSLIHPSAYCLHRTTQVLYRHHGLACSAQANPTVDSHPPSDQIKEDPSRLASS